MRTCSPGRPLNLTVGSISNLHPADRNRSASASQSSIEGMTSPKCGTGTPWPSTWFLITFGAPDCFESAVWGREGVKKKEWF